MKIRRNPGGDTVLWFVVAAVAGFVLVNVFTKSPVQTGTIVDAWGPNPNGITPPSYGVDA